ncbi:flagellar basal body-associated FliL family protein [Novosphingobium malaysiense]|uniref:Flagellar protein FliL n=1 Tax=Novosphingobium malaysiense TaxID=1348853 RepID=A0A0B1ZVK3_9SPHN|nr:flagellar basal body-associated FliL family protein [Novosphingobium malaysiense]KHK93494.1 flagellar basal body-associated protein FliL [Novosphingobium malaysiense]
MSDKHAKEGKAKNGKGKLMIILVAVGMLVLGGGGVFGLVAAGVIGGGHAAEVKERGPQLIRKGEDDPYMPKPSGKDDDGEALMDVEGVGGDEYRTAYFTFSDDFTSNLRDSAALIQTSLACSTRRDGRVLIWMKKHELAIRSKLLQILADTPEDDVYTIPGKEKLQKRMTDAINKVLIEKEGFGGVDAVYFRTFIIQ